MTEYENKPAEKKRSDGSIFVGILLLALGALFLLENLDVVHVGSIWSFWPFVLVAFGVQKLARATGPEHAESGVWMIFFGLWLYVSLEHIWDLGFSETWPALLIMWGLELIWKSFGRPWPFLRKEMSS